VRLTMGARDLAEGKCEITRRDTLEKQTIAVEDAVATIERLLEEIQANLFLKAKTFREENTRKADTWEEFVNILENEGGFISAHWDGTPETEEKIKELTKATIRCIPFDAVEEEGKCILTGKPSHRRVIFAKAY
ncbi:MAG: proline--tRNA ligase, partial [Bacteroidales bacterium]|nr:proline--tRNA ligase [Bacteroidales bacterium]